MTYAVTNPPVCTAQAIAGPSIWIYTSDDDNTDVDATGYFTNGNALGMKVGDVVHVIESDDATHTVHQVITSTAGGAATIGAAT